MIAQYSRASDGNHHTNERSAARSTGAAFGIGSCTQCWFTVNTSTSRNTATMLANTFTATPSGQRRPSNGGKRRPSQMIGGVRGAHTREPGMLRRNAVRNGSAFSVRREYTATWVESNRPHAVHTARITHTGGYVDRLRRPLTAQ